LAADERLEVVVNDRLGQGRELSIAPCMKEDRVPAEALGLTCDGGFGAVERASDLPVAGTGGKP
jgi:hypothetical protein